MESVAETAVGTVWRDVLGIEAPEPDDDFFLLGGDSLSALAVTKRLLEWDGKGTWPCDGIVEGPFALMHLRQHSVLRDYAAHLKSTGATTAWARVSQATPYHSHRREKVDGLGEGCQSDDECDPPAAQAAAMSREGHTQDYLARLRAARALRRASAVGDLDAVVTLQP